MQAAQGPQSEVTVVFSDMYVCVVCMVASDVFFFRCKALKMTDAATSKLDEYRGSKHWKGLIPAAEEPRVWDEGFRDFLLK